MISNFLLYLIALFIDNIKAGTVFLLKQETRDKSFRKG